MSADRWRVCPRCQIEKDLTVAAKERASRAAYGAVSVEEFDAMRHAAVIAAEVSLAETFREDYEVGLMGRANFYVSYLGRCTACGFEHSFNHDESLEVTPR